MEKTSPELVIIAGPNGSGKTTLAKEYLDSGEGDYTYLSADDIASELDPKNLTSVRLTAGRVFFHRFNKFVENEEDLLIESTLSGKTLEGILKKIQTESNYYVTIIFIFLDNEALCIERVKTRVRKGGHPVPKEDIIRRFGRSIVNFWNIYRHLSDRWMLYYNTEDSFQEVAHNAQQMHIYDEMLFDFFKEIKADYE